MSAGTELKQYGNRWQGLCPFHDDNEPSFYVYSDNHFKCFGCGQSGDGIDLVQEVKGFDFKEATQYLSGRS